MTDKQFLTSAETLLPAKADPNSWPPEAHEVVALTIREHLGSSGVDHRPLNVEGSMWGSPAALADAVLAALAPYRADALAAASREQEARAEAGRLRDILRDIAADCEADYPPSHSAIKYVCHLALKEY